MTQLAILALLCTIILLIGWLAGYAMGKKQRRVRIVHPAPEVEYVTRLNSRHLNQEITQ